MSPMGIMILSTCRQPHLCRHFLLQSPKAVGNDLLRLFLVALTMDHTSQS